MNLDKINFPLGNYEKLVKDISGFKFDEWINFWEREREILSYVSDYYGKIYKDDWLWGIILPILSDVYTLKNSTKERLVIGL